MNNKNGTSSYKIVKNAITNLNTVDIDMLKRAKRFCEMADEILAEEDCIFLDAKFKNNTLFFIAKISVDIGSLVIDDESYIDTISSCVKTINIKADPENEQTIIVFEIA